MSEPPDLQSDVGAWIKKAEHDLINAEHTLTMGADCPYDTVCFHGQQCVEKYLKAYLVYRGIDFPKVHDIRPLMQLVPSDARLGLELAEVIVVNRFIQGTRYPGDWEEFGRQDADEAVVIARKVRAAVRARLPWHMS